MAFPTSPTNGQQANINGITYTYSNTLPAWTVSTSVSNTFVSISVSGNVNSGNILNTGLISTTGNITGGNMLTGGLISATGTISGNLINSTVTNYVEAVVVIGTVTTTNTIALTNGTVQTATLTASTACTFTMPANVAGKSFVLLLKQAAATGNGTATFTGVKWGTAGAPTITATAGKMDILTFIADGTNWYGSIAQGYTP